MTMQMPADIEAEMAVLGAIYIDSSCYYSISSILGEDDFFIKKHKELFAVFSECIFEGQIDLVTIKDKLVQRNSLDMVGGIKYVYEIADFLPMISGVERYAKIVAECSQRRKMIKGCELAISGLYDRGKNLSKITDYIQSNILGETVKTVRMKNIKDSCIDLINSLKARQNAGIEMPGIATGYEDVDNMIGGLEEDKLYVLGGRPSMGKSALALNIISNVVANGNYVAFFSLEMKDKESTRRLASARANIPGQKLKRADLNDEDYDSITKALETNDNDCLFTIDDGYQTIQSITNTCISLNIRLAKKEKKLNCVVIDHLQLISSLEKSKDRRLQIGEMTRGLKLLANKLGCAVLLLSQLSRFDGKRKSTRPILSDLRESGDIEQDADVVMFIHRDEYYGKTIYNQGKAELIIAKNRDGESGIIELGWKNNITKFVPWAEYDNFNVIDDKKVQKEIDAVFEQTEMEV